MAELYEVDYGTAFYRSKDPIKNLKIRVSLDRVTSATVIPQAVLEQQQDGDSGGGRVEMQELQEQFGGQQDGEKYTFQWLKKVFCQREVELYADASACQTVLERKYHQDTAELGDKGRPTKRLFTYIDHDAFTNTDENTKLMTTSPNEKPTLLAEKMNNLRLRRIGARKKEDLGGYTPKLNLVSAVPSEDLIKKNHLLSTPVQTMYIMADLSPHNKNPTEDDEHVLCTVKFDSNGVISICPDFSKGSSKYRIETSGIGRDVFEYTIEHASRNMSQQEVDRERKMLKQLYNRHTDYLTSLVGGEFEALPPLEALRVLVYGEIVSTKFFEYDDIYISFFVDLPMNWYQLSGQLSGVTQVCQTKTEGREQVAYFCFPFDFELMYKDESLDNDKKERLPKWPTLYYEVLSLDSWERYRTEGYGYMTLPSSPGRSSHTIHCWRPAGQSCVSELRRFFIGGSPEVEELTYTSIPSTFEGSHLSKFGFRTVSTGDIEIQLNTIHQSQAFQHSINSKKKVGSLLDRLRSVTAQTNILNVLEAFQQAKQRMIAARENLRTDFIETVRTMHDLGDDDSD